MPEKSIREMNAFERMHYSLSSRTFRSVILGSLIFGLVALAVGLGLYTWSLAERCISDAFNLSRSAAVILERAMETGPLCNDVMEIYRGMSDEERAAVGTDEYRAKFADIESREDYSTAVAVLDIFRGTSDVYDIYLAMYDRDTSAMVYIADPDPDPEFACAPGDWESVKPSGLEKFMSWDGSGMLHEIDRTDKYGWLCTSGVPIKNAAGETEGFVLSDVTLANVTAGVKKFLLQYSLAMLITVNVFGILLARHIKKKIVTPINEIAAAAQSYVADRREGKSSAEHFSALDIHTGDEIENLSLVMADMEHDLNDYENNLTRVTAEKERIGTELALATRIQADMLPNVFPAFPERSEFDIFATMTPAKEVGGDFYDFFLIDEDRLGMVMADVSGKGVPAALFMMVSKILLKIYAMGGKSPAEVLETLNSQICGNNREEMFITVWLGILDIKTGKLTAANAGHEYPVLKRPGKDFEMLRDKHGFVIGGFASAKYTEYEIVMEPGTKLFLYTDGVPEASDGEEKLFGMERMLAALNAGRSDTPYDVLESVSEAVELFVGDAPQFDDVTMLCLNYLGFENGKGGTDMKELTVEATIENIAEVTEFVNTELEKIDCPPKAQMQIDIAIDELFGNIAHYAYDPDTGPATVRVEVEKDPMAVIITFIDNGKPYDPLKQMDPDITLSAEERQVGGLGIFLVKRTMDDISYEYKDGQNILRIKKSI